MSNPTPQPSESKPDIQTTRDRVNKNQPSESQPVQEEFEKVWNHWICNYLLAPDAFDMELREDVSKGMMLELFTAQRQQAAEEATQKERERCLECVDELKRKIWMPKGVPIEDGELDTIQGILDSQNKRVVELEKAVTASNTWNLALDEIRDKIKNG